MVEVFFPMILVSWLLIYFTSYWTFMEKSGYPGWFAFIPVFNWYILTRIAGRSGWWALAFLVPILNLAARLLIWSEISERYGKSTGYSIGLAWFNPIFLPMLALSDAKMDEPPTQWADFRSDLESQQSFNTFTNENGETIQEIPLEDWE